MTRYITHIIFYSLLLLWIYGSSVLSRDNFLIWGVCPNINIIPACYIILVSFIWLWAIHILKLRNRNFYILAAIPLLIALYGTVFQIFWWVECPKTWGGIPMCFISLSIFTGLVVCKYIMSKKTWWTS